MARLTITLTPNEKAALTCYAREKRRDPRDQAAIEIQKILEQAGYLQQAAIKAGQPAQPQATEVKR